MQTKLAAGNFLVPVVKGADAGLGSPFMKRIADNLAKSNYHQNFYDQSLGPSVGRVVNDAGMPPLANWALTLGDVELF